jgi:hypothetical protein
MTRVIQRLVARSVLLATLSGVAQVPRDALRCAYEKDSVSTASKLAWSKHSASTGNSF